MPPLKAETLRGQNDAKVRGEVWKEKKLLKKWAGEGAGRMGGKRTVTAEVDRLRGYGNNGSSATKLWVLVGEGGRKCGNRIGSVWFI